MVVLWGMDRFLVSEVPLYVLTTRERQRGLFKTEMLLQVGICAVIFSPWEPLHAKFAMQKAYLTQSIYQLVQ